MDVQTVEEKVEPVAALKKESERFGFDHPQCPLRFGFVLESEG